MALFVLLLAPQASAKNKKKQLLPDVLPSAALLQSRVYLPRDSLAICAEGRIVSGKF
jgi:hypothetical protein